MKQEILKELETIKKELQDIRSILESRVGQKPKMSDFEVYYRSLTERERNLISWAVSLEKDSEALKIIKKLSSTKKSQSIM